MNYLSASPRFRTLLLMTGICGGPFLIGIDMLSIGVALAPMAEALDASLSTLQWFMSGYGIGVATFLITAGKLSDIFGSRNVNRVGLLLFGAASALMAMAPSSGVAIAARLLQGVAGAAMVSSSIAIAGQRYSGHERARIFSLIMAMAGLGMGLGPLIGGILIHYFDWRAAFWVNVPATLLWFLLNTFALPRDEVRKRERFDFVGLILLSASILFFVVPLSQANEWGWFSPATLGLFGAFVVCLLIFVVWERKVRSPLLDFAVFGVRGYIPASLCAFLSYFVALGWLFLFSLYLHHVKGYGALATGFSFLPYSFGYFFAGLYSTKIGERMGWRRFLFFGTVLLASGVGLLSFVGTGTPYVFLAGGFALVGVGYIFANNSAMTLAQGEVPSGKAGAASGISMMFRWLGSALGITVMSLVLHASSQKALDRALDSTTVSIPFSEARLERVLTEDGSWSKELSKLSAQEAKPVKAILAESYTQGVNRGLLVLAICGAGALALIRWVPQK